MNIPLEPTQSNGIPFNVTLPSVTLYGININHDTKATAAPDNLSTFNSLEKEYAIPTTAKIAIISNVALVGLAI